MGNDWAGRDPGKIVVVYGDLQHVSNLVSSRLRRPMWMAYGMGIPVRMVGVTEVRG